MLRPGAPPRTHARLAGFLVALAAGSASTAGTELQVEVHDGRGKPVVDAVVGAYPLDASPELPPTARAVIDQIGEEFVPHVTVIHTGTTVSFPNRDDVRHHVYSFSPAKTFELPLYKGTSAEPVVFDRPGTVVLGCNIHDWMTAYVFVLGTPYFAKTDETGVALVAGLPPGRYRVEVQHPRARSQPESRTLSVGSAPPSRLTVRIELGPDLRRPRGPRPGDRGYR